MKALWTALAVAAFIGVLYAATVRDQQYECEVCVETGGRTYCVTASAPDRETAVAGAQSNACGTAAAGMDAEMQCRNAVPISSRCRP